MKVLNVIFFAICSTCAAQYSGVKEFGYKGDISKITKTTYFKTDLNDWSQNYAESVIGETEFFFNNENNLIKSVKHETVESYTTIYELKKGKPIRFKTFDSNNKLQNTGTYYWENDYSYAISYKTKKDKDIHEFTINIKLKNDFNVKQAISEQKNNDTLVFISENFFLYDKRNYYDGYTLSETYPLKNNTPKISNISIKNDKYDRKGNLIEYEKHNDNSATYELIKFKIEYR
ncbi:MAG: hypothetical protein ACK5NB_10895 [Flavobacteriaceae bacterium]